MVKTAAKAMPGSVAATEGLVWKWNRSVRAQGGSMKGAGSQGNTRTLLLLSHERLLTLGQPSCCLTLL